MKKLPSPRVEKEELWSAAPLPCLVLDTRANVLTLNAAAARFIERDAASCAGASLAEFFEPAEAVRARLRSRRALRPGEEITGVLRRRAGGPVDAAVHLQRVGAGKNAAVLAWLSDRSVEHELREKLEHSEKLSAMAIVAGKVAHEIRTPLNAIFLNNDLLQERAGRLRAPQRQKLAHYLAVLQEEVERLNEIVGSYLSLARLPGGRREPVDIDRFLLDFITEMRREFAGRDLSIVTAFRARPARLSLNQRQFRRVLLNLFSNCRDAARRGGMITLSTEDSPRGYRITVTDNGEGIPPDALTRLTTPFISSKGNGSGLGLYLAREIVENHGGVLEIQSLQGEGTSVIITLPVPRRTRRGSRKKT